MSALIAGLAAALLSILLVRLSIPILERLQVIDHPSARSSHTRPTPRGGGAGLLVAAAIPTLAAAFWSETPQAFETTVILFSCAGALALIGIADDVSSLPPLVRLAAQFGCVGAALTTVGPAPTAVFGDLLPAWLAFTLIAIGWVWFINLFNFMDGIDGLAGAQAAVAGGAIAFGAFVGLAPAATATPALAIAGASLGFLVWNWAPARLFMGDVGSAPLGFLLGWLLLSAAAAGAPALAALPTMLFKLDATATLLRRALRRAPIWRAHREHAFQRAAQAFGAHAPVARRFAATATALGGAALVIETLQSSTLALAAILVAAAAAYLLLERWARG